MATASDDLPLAQARALWWQKQGLGTAARSGSVATVVAASGWLRTLGGADVYLAARARRPGLGRAELDAAVEAGELRVVPAARGCIYLVPGGVVAALRALNGEGWRAQTERELAKAKSSMAVVEEVADAVLGVLAQPLTTDGIRKALPAGSIPSFGEAGKKVGLSSPLPTALRLLELDGRIERTLEGGRLDTDRYLWRRARPVAPAGPAGEAPLETIVRAFLGFGGPVTIADLAAWSGRAQRELAPALARIGAAPIQLDGAAAWALPGDAAARAPAPSGLALLAFEDNFLALHGVAAVSDPRHHAVRVDLWGDGKAATVGEARHVLSRTIALDGQVVGFWELDPRREGAVWATFDPAPPALAKRLDEATADAARFLLGELGHARAYAIDTMDGVQQRADKVAALRAGTKAPAAKPASKPAPKKKPAPKRAAAAKR